jgi:rRNA maturation RNase YbeY
LGTITFHNHDVSFALKNKLLLKTFLASIFTMEGYSFRSVNYIFCNDTFLHALNKQYLQHDTFTDILTFSLSETSLPIIAEIYISIDRVKENAVLIKTSFYQEIMRVMIHGILHLCGYDDHSPYQKKKMRQREDFYISRY